MKTYYVGVQEVHIQTYLVEAESPEKARELASEMIEAGDESLETEYSHTLEPEEWTVTENIWKE